LLRAVVPKIEIVGVLWDSGTGSAQLATVKAAAQGIAVKLLVLETRNAVDLDVAFGAGLNGGANALVVLSSPVVGAAVNSNADRRVCDEQSAAGHLAIPEFYGSGWPHVLWSQHS
jgi:hypothetical protein